MHQDHQLHRHLLEPPEKEERRDSLESMVCRENPASRGSYTQPMDHQERRENLVHEGRPARKEGPVETERTVRTREQLQIDLIYVVSNCKLFRTGRTTRRTRVSWPQGRERTPRYCRASWAART